MKLHTSARLLFAALTVCLLAACAHPIGIGPLETPTRNEAGLSPKKVAYVMTDADRTREVIGVWSSLVPRERVIPSVNYFVS